MVNGIRLKVCGLRTAADAARAVGIGADFLGFILHPKSPRFIELADFTALAGALPKEAARVAVMVEPTAEQVSAAKAAGFDYFQIHFRSEAPLAVVRAWSDAVTPEKLWLAPKLPPGVAFNNDWLALAGSFLIDTFHAEGFGGSGLTGDWGAFARLQAAHPEKTWILAGGLNPENVGAAIAQSGARFVDVNSGVESAPGVKSAERIAALGRALAGQS